MDKQQEKGSMHETAQHAGSDIKFYVVLMFTGVLIVVIGWGLWEVRRYIPYIGYAVLGAASIILLCGVCFPIIALLRYATKAEWFDIAESGSVMRTILGHSMLYSPMTANAARITQRKSKVTVTPVIPSIIELIDSGIITLGQMQMHMGFELTKGGLLPVIDKWPGTFAIAGMGRSGKTRRVLTIIFQAIMGGARVFICDPHRTKRDGLAKMLAPLAPWLTIVKGEDEIVTITRFFLAEMRHRRQTELADNEAYWTPWVIVYDEWSYLMTTQDIAEDDKAVLIETVRDCSTQYAGYNGYAGVIGQVWTNEEAGGTVIRRSLHKVFVHQLNAEYAKFFLKGKWTNKAEELEPRQCLYRLQDSVKMIMTHDVPDNSAEWFADWLLEHMPPEQVAAPDVPKQVARPERTTGPLRLPEQVASHTVHPQVKQVSRSQSQELYERDTRPEEPLTEKHVTINNHVTERVAPIYEREAVTANGETTIVESEHFTMTTQAYTHDQETAILNAAFILVRETGKITRSDVMERLGWNRKQWPIIKAVCDKHNIAKQ